MYKFIVHKDDFDISLFFNNKLGEQKLTSATSVNQLKYDFFLLLSKIGELVQIDNTISKADIENICREDNVIYTSVHGNPPEGVACKFLNHSLGGFMVTGGFLGGWEFRNATINIVTSELQELQLKRSLAEACPNVSVVSPAISTKTFHLPIANEKLRFNKDENLFDLIYAGRFISNKGIAQLVRALNIWPKENTRLTLVGDFEPDFYIYHSNAYHTTFQNFFKREIIQQSANLKIKVHSAVKPEQLKDFYWSSNCFIYPSFHEDENFGLAPREAMLCGIPSVVTDFCGLGQLLGSKGGLVKTYPSLAGVRYSLHELSMEINKIRNWSDQEKENNSYENISFINEECCQEKALNSIKNELSKLKDTPIDPAPNSGWRSKERFELLVNKNKTFFEKAIVNKDSPIPQGLYVDGTGSIAEGKWFSESHLMQSIQSIYTTFPEPPKVKIADYYRGFWRISLWENESSIVEFGYPGPRMKKYNKKEWNELLASSIYDKDSEVIFSPKNSSQIKLIQDLLELGYLVPDNI